MLRKLHFDLPAIFLLGWLVYELTANPFLGMVSLCGKLGLDCFKTAQWLKNNDGNPLRGRAYWWLFISYGFLKTAIAGFLLFIFLLAFLGILETKANQQWGDFPLPHLLGTLLALMGGMAIEGLTAWIGLLSALFSENTIWIHRGINEARFQKVWPPALLGSQRNRLWLLLGNACFFAWAAFSCALAFSLGLSPNSDQWKMTSYVIATMAAAFVLAYLGSRLFQKVNAFDARQCWN